MSLCVSAVLSIRTPPENFVLPNIVLHRLYQVYPKRSPDLVERRGIDIFFIEFLYRTFSGSNSERFLYYEKEQFMKLLTYSVLCY